MTKTSEELNPQTLEERIITKAMEDPAYKQRLISNAKAVVEEELGDKLGENITIEVLQQSAKNLYLLLPADIDEMIRDGLISQEELEVVAGGRSIIRSTSIDFKQTSRNLKNIEAGLKSAVAIVSTVVLSRRATTPPK
ncbi:hypothetical protein WA1_13320 [Scytonema hofmannii PCC 7110]|uniref:Nitrile hydratase alpha /Thiocyanate hydrolase gamma domain-containing protein n=1 Tax=Scytonema hofmannii PCC 7110 TaxID=128403 RepID=A0A139XEH6_9CYAN|nr:NHLP leader peptide family RiPP precursor [Scytonema hofmannii]KYC43076.1 hypothetical protein WA1_13320 [Scytonema hofmannii PCC 7110]